MLSKVILLLFHWKVHTSIVQTNGKSEGAEWHFWKTCQRCCLWEVLSMHRDPMQSSLKGNHQGRLLILEIFLPREITFIRDGLTFEGWRYQIHHLVFSWLSTVQICWARRKAALCLAFQDLHSQNWGGVPSKHLLPCLCSLQLYHLGWHRCDVSALSQWEHCEVEGQAQKRLQAAWGFWGWSQVCCVLKWTKTSRVLAGSSWSLNQRTFMVPMMWKHWR